MKYRITVDQDTDASSPADWDNYLILVGQNRHHDWTGTPHRDLLSCDECYEYPSDHDDLETTCGIWQPQHDVVAFLALNDQWLSVISHFRQHFDGQLAVALNLPLADFEARYASWSDDLMALVINPAMGPRPPDIENIIADMVETWNQWLGGDVWWYCVEQWNGGDWDTVYGCGGIYANSHREIEEAIIEQSGLTREELEDAEWR